MANTYRGELLGLVAIHLTLLASDRVRPGMKGTVRVALDCVGALGKVSTLPANRIPSRCQHSDTLKNNMVNFSKLEFSIQCMHMEAHQYDSICVAPADGSIAAQLVG
jgi:hypothetical protein